MPLDPLPLDPVPLVAPLPPAVASESELFPEEPLPELPLEPELPPSECPLPPLPLVSPLLPQATTVAVSAMSPYRNRRL